MEEKGTEDDGVEEKGEGIKEDEERGRRGDKQDKREQKERRRMRNRRRRNGVDEGGGG